MKPLETKVLRGFQLVDRKNLTINGSSVILETIKKQAKRLHKIKNVVRIQQRNLTVNGLYDTIRKERKIRLSQGAYSN